MTEHVEVETKYDLAPDQPLPDLRGAGGVVATAASPEMTLTAVYHDTSTLALTAAGATLRRRTGGTDDGWHLKLPLSDGQRLEVREPLGDRREPPDRLLGLVRAVTVGEPVAPVATLVNHRTVHALLDGAGTVVAELADDSVRGERSDPGSAPVIWREMEIELVSGDRAALVALDAAARAGGAVPASGPSKVSRVLGPAGGPATDPLAAADPLVRLGRAEGVPHLREAVRRVAAGPVDDAVRRDLAWLDALLADHDDHPERLADALDSPRYLGLLAAARSRQRPEGPGSGGP